jgi:AraC-like DNA-binding protein
MAHVAALRLERAMARLAASDATIAEIALSCGYSDQSALTRALKRRHGVTPAAYRRSRRAMLQ